VLNPAYRLRRWEQGCDVPRDVGFVAAPRACGEGNGSWDSGATPRNDRVAVCSAARAVEAIRQDRKDENTHVNGFRSSHFSFGLMLGHADLSRDWDDRNAGASVYSVIIMRRILAGPTCGPRGSGECQGRIPLPSQDEGKIAIAAGIETARGMLPVIPLNRVDAGIPTAAVACGDLAAAVMDGRTLKQGFGSTRLRLAGSLRVQLWDGPFSQSWLIGSRGLLRDDFAAGFGLDVDAVWS